jgi:basic membrane lipoprotein Med (substrate-binding protein (PBP1-ABC) superfamily)
VTSAEKHLALAVSAAIVRISKGTDKGGNIVNDAKSDPVGVGISDFHDLKSMMTTDLQAKIDAALAGLKDGSLDPCKPQACTP